MALILTLDTMGERYSMLPSEILERGNTLDLYIMDVAMSYRNEQIKKQDKNYVPDVPQDQLQQLLEQSKKAMKHG
jgi:hypothetical protein